MSSNKSFDDLMDMPLDSSPLKPLSPPPVVSAAHGSTVPSRSESPSPTESVIPPVQRKCVAEDLTQYAGEVSCAHKLVKRDHDDLALFAKAERGEQLVFIAGQLLALNHYQRQLHPAEAAWSPSKKLQGKIDGKACALIADASIPAYKNDKIGPSKLLMTTRGQWMACQPHFQGFDQQAQHVKTLIGNSLGSEHAEGETLRPDALTVVELTTNILLKLKVKSKVDVALCGRVAILRKLISETTDGKYWGEIDSKLAGIRKKHPDTTHQSKFIKRYMLDPDLEMYGFVNLNKLDSFGGAIPEAGPSTVRHGHGSATADSEDPE
ncbi:hypothetical protein B0H13DRAFT_1872665 [Mycena leptocephala]|nr:hypothetical protein B0H13DRAFT_1872665 [Mycena leptocephala]